MTTEAKIPMPNDVSDLIGPFAERIENRSLLLDKFILHKSWPILEERTDRGMKIIKWDEASRWSFIRIAEGAQNILLKEASEKIRRSKGKRVSWDNKRQLEREANLARSLSTVNWTNSEIETLRSAHTRRLLGLLRKNHENSSVTIIAELESRLAINLADGLIQNAGISLDRLFGMPMIPGSAIKGACRHEALEELKASTGEKRKELFSTFVSVFGVSSSDFDPPKNKNNKSIPSGALYEFRDYESVKEQKGTISFIAAYPVNSAKIVVDLTNVHYPDYYKSGNERDLKKERPRPNPFPCVEKGAQFAFCLILNSKDKDASILIAAQRWLEAALTKRGLGAKTASGYGWFSLKPDVLNEIIEKEMQEAEAIAHAERQRILEVQKEQKEKARIALLSPVDRLKEEFLGMCDQAFADQIMHINDLDEDQKKGLILTLIDPAKRDRWKKWKKSKKPNDHERVKLINEIAKQLNISLP